MIYRATTDAPLFTFEGVETRTTEACQRLSTQYLDIFNLMRDGQFRTLKEIETALNGRYPQASISAQLRHMRKRRFGSHQIARKSLGGGLHSYQLTVNVDAPLVLSPANKGELE